MKVAERVGRVPPSGIRRFFELAEEVDDVISLGVGEPDFSAPWAAREAAIDSLERERTSYTANLGRRDLREAISRKTKERYGLEYAADDQIIVTSGASEAVDLAFRAFVDPGDTVAIPEPAYVSYVPGVLFSGGDPLPVTTTKAQSFKLTVGALEEGGAEDADVLVLCYPNNPTGAVLTAEELEPIAEYALEHDLTVISDEIYSELTYGGEHTSIASFPGMTDRTIVINGFSKAYAMTGLRLGYAMGPADAIAAMNRIHQYSMLSAPTTAQFAALEALRSCDDEVDAMVAQYNRRRRFVLSRFEEMGLDCFEAQGAFYVFPEVPDGDDEGFAEGLLEAEGVAVVPGRVFGSSGEGHLRVSYATGLDELKEAMRRIESYVDATY